jgi:hypothetical protein
MELDVDDLAVPHAVLGEEVSLELDPAIPSPGSAMRRDGHCIVPAPDLPDSSSTARG